MKTRREFIQSVSAAGMLGTIGLSAGEATAEAPTIGGDGAEDRRYWVSVLQRVANPVLENLARHELKANMPVEAANPADRRNYTHLEAFGRLLAGVAPWLEVESLEGTEAQQQKTFAELARASLDAATDPKSPDFMNFHEGSQPLVDAAFLAQGILRAPRALWTSLDGHTQKQVVAALKSSRRIPTPANNNWVMFAAMVEALLLTAGESTLEERLESSVRKMLGWYEGDGIYGDGAFFHFDYYNSFVIQPMLLDVLEVLRLKDDRFENVYATVLNRSRRHAEILERLIAPDGTFPSIGRSTTYRFGAMQTLAQISLLRELPSEVKPSQVRCALSAVIQKTIEAPGTFNEKGWLTIGFCGHQTELGENYISTGSLYLCSAGLLPLGLPPNDEFWKAPPAKWTSQRIWSGENVRADHAIRDVKSVEVPTLNRTVAK